jgi:Lrp/AsnC family transcriptional regulator, regulator for asnA, asnC and gidA
VPIDETDRRIMALLRHDGRCSYRRLAGETGLSESAVRHRVTRMVNNEVFKITIVSDPIAMGLLAARARLRVAGRPLSHVARDLAMLSESEFVALVTGELGVIVDLICDDHEHLVHLAEQVQAVEGVVDLDLTLLLQIAKNRVAWREPKTRATASQWR